eukprot:8229377-Ditylum_brightwellii.AAC.1
MDFERKDDELLECWEKLNSEDEGESINAGIETIHPMFTPKATDKSLTDGIASDLTDELVAADIALDLIDEPVAEYFVVITRNF